tara:strand:- start:1662 stop:3029 length:1368 start_codon:yes stop_codon:yes gene_type:complete
MRVAMWRYVFKLFDHEITMARVLISKATLADFGVPRQDVMVRPPQPTAEDIERVVRQSDAALTPREFVNKVPLIERKEQGNEERFGGVGKRFGSQMGLEGALAHGVAAAEYPQILDAEDPLSVPFIRDYYSRQTTLPEYDYGYHTEGPYYDEQGNILPGQVPPVDAVKIMGEGDISSMGRRTGYGLKPLPLSTSNIRWEASRMRPQERFPIENAGFVGALRQRDVDENIPGSVSDERGGVVGIRGFGRPQDKAFMRPAYQEGAEGIYTAPIPPERLVGVLPGTNMSRTDLQYGAGRGKELQNLFSPEPDFDAVLQQMVEEGKASPMDAIFASIRNRVRQKQRMEPDYTGMSEYFPKMLFSLRDTPSGPNSLGRKTLNQVDAEIGNSLPLNLKEGVFGLENPLLTEAEKQAYIDDINRRRDDPHASMFDEDELKIDEYDKENLPVLYPKQAGVRFL